MTARLSDEERARLQRRVEVMRLGAAATDGNTAAAMSQHAADLAALLAENAALAAEVERLRDRIGQAEPWLIRACMHVGLGGEAECAQYIKDPQAWCYPCVARAALGESS